MSFQSPESGENGLASTKLHERVEEAKASPTDKDFDANSEQGIRKLPYTFAEHAWALRHLRKEGITPTNSTILEVIKSRRASLESETEASSSPSLPVVHPVDVPSPPVNSLAEPYDSISENAFFDREIIRQEEFLADAREWNHYLLARVDGLMAEIVELQERSGLIENETDSGAATCEITDPEQTAIPQFRESSAGDVVLDWEKMLSDVEEQRKQLENQVEELRAEHVLNQSLEKVIEEQRHSLESLGRQVESLTSQLEEAVHLKIRAEQLHAELVEARASLEAYRNRESASKMKLSQQEVLRARADSELQRLQNALEQEQAELSHLRGENDQFAGKLENERARLHAEQTRSAAIIAQLTRQLEEERELRLEQEKKHSSEVEQLCFHFEQERLEFEIAQKESAETIHRLQKQVEELQQIVATARAATLQNARLQEAEARLKEFEDGAASTGEALEKSRADLQAASVALRESEIRAAEAHKALDELRAESEARIARLESTIAELEQALTRQTAPGGLHESSAAPEEIENLRKDLRIQTETAEKHKAAIRLLQSKLQETETELVELRDRRPEQSEHTPFPEIPATSLQDHFQQARTPVLPPPVSSQKIPSRFVALVGALLFILAAGVLGLRYFGEIQVLLLPTPASEPQTAEIIETSDSIPPPAAPTTASVPPAPATSTNPEVAPADDPELIPTNTEISPSVIPEEFPPKDWNLTADPAGVLTDEVSNPSSPLDLQSVPGVWQEPQPDNSSPVSSDASDESDFLPNAATTETGAESEPEEPLTPLFVDPQNFVSEIPQDANSIMETIPPLVQTEELPPQPIQVREERPVTPEASMENNLPEIRGSDFIGPVLPSPQTPSAPPIPKMEIPGHSPAEHPELPPVIIRPHEEFPRFVPGEEVGDQ